MAKWGGAISWWQAGFATQAGKSLRRGRSVKEPLGWADRTDWDWTMTDLTGDSWIQDGTAQQMKTVVIINKVIMNKLFKPWLTDWGRARNRPSNCPAIRPLPQSNKLPPLELNQSRQAFLGAKFHLELMSLTNIHWVQIPDNIQKVNNSKYKVLTNIHWVQIPNNIHQVSDSKFKV